MMHVDQVVHYLLPAEIVPERIRYPINEIRIIYTQHYTYLTMLKISVLADKNKSKEKARRSSSEK